MLSEQLLGRSILLVEKDPLLAWELEDALVEAGASVKWIKSITEAKESVRVRSYSAAIIDYAPGSNEISGLVGVLRRRGIPIMVYSSWDCASLGLCCSDCLASMPADLDELVRRLSALSPPDGGPQSPIQCPPQALIVKPRCALSPEIAPVLASMNNQAVPASLGR